MSELDELNARLQSAWGSFRTAHMTARMGMGPHRIDPDGNDWLDGTIVEAWIEPAWDEFRRTRFRSVHSVGETIVEEVVSDGRDWWWRRGADHREGRLPLGAPTDGVVDTMLFHDLAHEHGGVESELDVSDIAIDGDRASFTVRRGEDDHPPDRLDFGLCPGDWWCDSYRVTTGLRNTLARVEARYADGSIAMTCDATVEFDIDIPASTFAAPD